MTRQMKPVRTILSLIVVVGATYLVGALGYDIIYAILDLLNLLAINF